MTTPPTPVRVLDPSSTPYRQAFDLFLAGTDEKALTHTHLTGIVTQLKRRDVLLDIGAGEGGTTAFLAKHFRHTVAVEPSPAMRDGLRRACPDAVILPEPVDEAEPPDPADLALLSHMLYYLPEEHWLPTLERVLSWVAPDGVLVVLLQNPRNACQRMVEHFTGTSFDLRPTARRLAERQARQVSDWSLQTLDVHYRTTHLSEAVDVAEFMVNVPALRTLAVPPTLADLTAYARKHFARPDGTYVIGHAHDVLRIHRAPA